MDDDGRPEAGKDAGGGPRRDVEGGGQSSGIPAAGTLPTGTSPTGGPGFRHWQEATISEPGLDDRGDVFFAAVEMTRMPMILTDPNLPDNPIVFANRAFQDLTGYHQDEIVGRNCRFLQGARTDRGQVAELRQAVAERRAIAVELLNYKRDGTPFWNAVFVAPVHEKGGKLLYFFASQLDVTRRRTSEQAFRQAQKMEAVGQLTAGLAHDFNNLLQAVSGNLEVLRDKLAGDERLRRYVDRAREAAERGARLTQQLLAFARKTRLDPKPVDLSQLVQDFSELLESTVGTRMGLRLDLRRKLPPVLVDPVHLEMALLNVVINARDAMAQRSSEGGRGEARAGNTITISTAAMDLDGGREADRLPAGRYVALTIADEGVGMAPHVLERATEPFFTTKGAGKGTGLGLAMAHGFVQQSHGKLEIESELGRGTTVRLLFPAAEDAPAHLSPGVLTGTAVPAMSPAARAVGEGEPETILIVEDNEDVLALAREHLRILGYRVITARNADEALAALDGADEPGGARINLLFSDILMPGSINGLVLAEKVRERLPGVPVLLTTGYNEDLVTEGPHAASMDVLGKPYRRSDLADRVRAALNRAADVTAPAARAHPGPRHEG